MRVAELIAVRPVAPIVEPGEVADLRIRLRSERDRLSEATRARLQALIADYVVTDAHNRVALDTLARSLSGARGGGFFINGVFGAGKSHLLALLGLVGEFAEAQSMFVTANPEYAAELTALAARQPLVIMLSLEEYAPQRIALEDLFWRSTRSEAAGQGVRWPAFAEDHSRSEQFTAFADAVGAAGRRGVIWLVDELSMFLGGRGRTELQADASFLQFLGQRLGRGPTWLVAALQKDVEHIGELDPYAVAQIRDRYHTRLMLSLAHVRTVVPRRMLMAQPALADALEELYARLHQRLPLLDFGPDDLRATYPFHPTTLDLLEAAAGRFFSRTRSALRFAQETLSVERLQAPADRLVTPDEILDYFAPDLAAHPELRALHDQALAYYQREAGVLAPQAAPLALRLAKLLIIAKVAGVNPTVAQCANWLLADGGGQGRENYVYVQSLLECFLQQGAYVAVERRVGEFADRVTLDLGARVNELLRRRLANLAFTLETEDRRMLAAALRACDEPEWPLAPPTQEHSVSWLNTERRLRVERRDLRTLRKADLQQRRDLLATSAAVDLELCLAEFVAVDAQREHWLRFAGPGPDSRWTVALVALVPREPTREEWARLREYTAAELLGQDPELRDNRRGRALLERLAADRPQREADVRRLVRRLYQGGEVIFGTEFTLRVDELISEAGSFADLLREVAERALPRLHPDFPPHAPRARMPGEAAVEALGLELVRTADEAGLPLAVERMARALLMPLGLVEDQGGGLRIAPLADRVRAPLLDCLEGARAVALAALEQQLRKSPLGLPPELARVAVLALWREGELVVEAADGAPPEAARLRPPLRETLHTVRRGRLLSTEVWRTVIAALSAFCKFAPRQHTLRQQWLAADLLRRWRDEARAVAELTQARLTQLRTLAPAAVNIARGFLNNWSEVLQAVVEPPEPAEMLEQTMAAWRGRLGDEAGKALRAFGKQAHELNATLESCQRPALDLHLYLNEAEVVAPPGLGSARERALAFLGASDSLVAQLPMFVRTAQEWKDQYVTAYLEWHEQVHGAQAARELESALAHPALRCAQQIARLTFRDFPQARRAQQMVSALTAGVCRPAALPQHLQVKPVCPQCRLRLGERPERLAPNALEQVANAALEEFRAVLQQPEVRAALQNYPGEKAIRRDLTTLLEQNEATPPETWRSLLTDPVVSALESALASPRHEQRSLATLRAQLVGRRLRRDEAGRLFTRWLDGETPLHPQDEVEFSD